MGSTHEKYLIIGAGIFGASTALYQKQADPSARVTLIDRTPFPCPSAASHDLNKIVRADYDDIFYMKLAVESVHLWRNDPLYKPHYHESGMLIVEDMGWGQHCMENYKKLGIDVPAEIITPEEARERFPVHKDADWSGLKQAFWNPTSGWADAASALRDVTQAAIDEGVEYLEATVSTLSFDQKGRCIGLRTADGTELRADNIVLCTGPYTAKLIADSAPERQELQVDGRMVAAGAISGAAIFDPTEAEKFSKVPVCINTLELVLLGESIPPNSNGKLKLNHETSFTHMTEHKASGQEISMPPTPVTQSTWGQDVPVGLKKEIQMVVRNMYGDQIKGLEVESYRMCWDAVTPNQHWIISPHPHCESLFIAGGGSFHSWKFLPTIGKYVVEMMRGELSGEMASRWAWNRGNDGGSCPMYIPKRDLKDIEGYKDIEGAVGHNM